MSMQGSSCSAVRIVSMESELDKKSSLFQFLSSFLALRYVTLTVPKIKTGSWNAKTHCKRQLADKLTVLKDSYLRSTCGQFCLNFCRFVRSSNRWWTEPYNKVCHACLGPFYFIFPAKFETIQLLYIIVLGYLQVIKCGTKLKQTWRILQVTCRDGRHVQECSFHVLPKKPWKPWHPMLSWGGSRTQKAGECYMGATYHNLQWPTLQSSNPNLITI